MTIVNVAFLTTSINQECFICVKQVNHYYSQQRKYREKLAVKSCHEMNIINKFTIGRTMGPLIKYLGIPYCFTAL